MGDDLTKGVFMKSKKVIFLIFLVFTIVLTLSFILLACIHVYNKKSNSNNVIITEDYNKHITNTGDGSMCSR